MGRRERGGFCMKHSAQTLFFLFVILGVAGGRGKGLGAPEAKVSTPFTQHWRLWPGQSGKKSSRLERKK